jgi:Ni,Fe-hydrogenase III small subunit/formate hydrogenlyase subunit 6/NADH:ubiquinone oxidoreductase subunit I
VFDVLLARIKQKYRTIKFPAGPAPALPQRFVGRPVITDGNCPPGCAGCVEACPTGALEQKDGLRLDLGRCLFCSECAAACAVKTISFTPDYRMATRRRDDLLIDSRPFELAQPLDARLQRLFGRSLRLRQVSAGGCNACEADTNVLGTVGWDLGRFGIQFVASPRHADGLLITGPVPENMRLALLKTYEAVPAPKLVIAVGACAIAGGPYIGHAEVHDGADGLLPVDLFIPGCPPHPLTILDGLLRLLGRLETSIGEGAHLDNAGPDASGEQTALQRWCNFDPEKPKQKA